MASAKKCVTTYRSNEEASKIDEGKAGPYAGPHAAFRKAGVSRTDMEAASKPSGNVRWSGPPMRILMIVASTLASAYFF